LILANVLIDEGDALLRKKLFLSVARPSTRLGIHDNRLSHLEPLSKIAAADPTIGTRIAGASF
jgi:hypothetical protein